ncbi:MAG: TIGR04442 family protein [Pelovirga sp.]
MKTELRLHGSINQQVEYFATAAGCRLPHHHFYAIEEDRVRFFSPGNELILAANSISQRGTGGTLCSHMYGDQLPAADLVRDGVVNRLTLLGATVDQHGQLQWSNHHQGVFDYNQLFSQGHAIHNYFFFIHGLAGDTIGARQEKLLRLLGKNLKRLPEPAQADDSRLATCILSQLPHDCTLYLVRLTHTRNLHFQQELRNLYYPHRNMADIHLKTLDELAEHLHITPLQQERIRLDVIYRHRDNYRIADSYRKILLTCAAQRRITPAQQQQITRISTMALRQQVPEILLRALDHNYLSELEPQTREAEHITTTRNLLSQLVNGPEFANESIAELLLARQQARKHHDYRFDEIIEEFKTRLDEPQDISNRDRVRQQFNNICLLFDNVDITTTAINRIVFLDNHLPAETVIYQLLTRYQEFSRISPGLFEQLFFTDLNKTSYIGNFGRRKLTHLRQGLTAVTVGHLRVNELYEELHFITGEEQHFRNTLTAARDWLTTNNTHILIKDNQDELYHALNSELRSSNMFNLRLNRQMFEKVLHDLHMEHVYLHEFLPQIIRNDNRALREDFFRNSGLDYFQIEEIELAYARDNNLDPDLLQRLQCNL